MKHFIDYLAAAIGTFLLCSFVWSWPDFPPHVFNADSLLPTSYMWDVMNHSNAWREFQLPRIPSFFPDLTFYGALHVFFADYHWAIFGYSFLQCFAFVFVGGLIISRATNIRVTATSMMLMLVSVVLTIDLFVGAIYHHFSIFTLVEHFGSFLLSLFGVAIVLTTLDRVTLSRGFLLVIFCFLSFLSSRLFAATFLIPLIVALFALVSFKMVERNVAVCLTFLSSIGVGLAGVADKFVTREPDLPVERIFAHVKSMLWDMAAYFSTHSASAIVSIIIPCLVFLTLPLVRQYELRKNRTFLFLWIFAATASSGVLLIYAISYRDITSFRYLVAFLYWPIIFVGITLVLISRKLLYISAIASGIFSAFFALQIGSNSFAFAHWQHPLATCLMKDRDSLGLKAGLSEYWLSRPATIGTNWTVQVDQIDSHGRPYFWGNNPQWYWKSFASQQRPPEYNFIVVNNLDQTVLNARFAAPDHVASCGEYTLWIYNNASALYEKLMAR
jgi:hypothetical protein